MFIIFGLRVRASTRESRVFFCPHCGTDRHGDVQWLRRWFTLFFIPVIPFEKVGEQVRCRTCTTPYLTRVLDLPTVASLASTLNNALHALVVMIVATGDSTDPALRARAVAKIASFNAGYDDALLSSDLLKIDTSFAAAYVMPLAERMEVMGRERFLQQLLELAGPSPTEGQLGVIAEAGRGLELSVAHVNGIVGSSASLLPPPAGDTGIPSPGADPPPG